MNDRSNYGLGKMIGLRISQFLDVLCEKGLILRAYFFVQIAYCTCFLIITQNKRVKNGMQEMSECSVKIGSKMHNMKA